MNIYESQPELENNKTKTKKLMIIIGVAIVILFVRPQMSDKKESTDHTKKTA